MEWSVGLEFVAKAVARNFEIGKIQVDEEDENFHADHDMKNLRCFDLLKAL